MSAARYNRAIPSPMTFLSLAPVASDSYAQQQQQTERKPSVSSTAKPSSLHRHNSTSSEASASSSEAFKQMRFLKLGHQDGDWSEYPAIPPPMNFLSLAPVASDSYAQHAQETERKSSVSPAAEPFTFHRHDSTSSDASASSSEGASRMRFLKLGHKDGDWSEDVIEV